MTNAPTEKLLSRLISRVLYNHPTERDLLSLRELDQSAIVISIRKSVGETAFSSTELALGVLGLPTLKSDEPTPTAFDDEGDAIVLFSVNRIRVSDCVNFEELA